MSGSPVQLAAFYRFSAMAELPALREELLALAAEACVRGTILLAEEGVERIDGDHCYAFYTGIEAFNAMHADEPGTFYLTDYLAKHFDRPLGPSASEA